MSDLSRGEIISLIAGIPAAIALTTESASAADNKKQFHYQDKPGPGGKKCSGWCIAWAKR